MKNEKIIEMKPSYAILKHDFPIATAETKQIADDIKWILDKCFPADEHKIVEVGMENPKPASFSHYAIVEIADVVTELRASHEKLQELNKQLEEAQEGPTKELIEAYDRYKKLVIQTGEKK